MAITVSEKELVPPKTYKIQWLWSFMRDVQNRSTCKRSGDPQGTDFIWQ